MAKRFVRIEIPDDEGDPPEIVLVDYARISLCEIREGTDGSEWYHLLDEKDQTIICFDVNLMATVVEAIEAVERRDSWGEVPD